MGYDMYWLEPMEPADQAAYDQANLQQAVHEAYAMNQADKGYFRLNVWGMDRYRNFMCEIGMVHEYGPEPEFPKLSDYGLTDWPDEGDDSPEIAAYRADHEAVLRYNPEVPGIAIWKLCSNYGWIVTPIECQGALHAWEEAGCPNPDTAEPEYWLQWIDYLRGAVDHGGFRVW